MKDLQASIEDLQARYPTPEKIFVPYDRFDLAAYPGQGVCPLDLPSRLFVTAQNLV